MTPLDNKRRDEAAAWFTTRRRGAMVSEDRVRLEDWLTDGDNRRALDSMEALWQELEGLKAMEGVESLKPTPMPPVRRVAWALPLAACLVLALVGAFWLSEGRLLPEPVRTAIGQQRVVRLPDGTLADLNVVTHIEYRMGLRQREVDLRDGEALFHVHPDASRPFIVKMGDYEVRDVGTVFDVRRRDGDLLVSVLEGEVSFRDTAGPDAGHASALLTAGRRLSLVSRSGAASWTVSSVPVGEMAQWRTRTVAFQNAPISEVVDDINRYFPRQLEIQDPSLAARRVTIRLELSDRQGTLQTLNALLGTTIRRGTDADFIVSGPQPSPDR